MQLKYFKITNSLVRKIFNDTLPVPDNFTLLCYIHKNPMKYISERKTTEYSGYFLSISKLIEKILIPLVS